MAAVDTKHLINIIAVNKDSGISKRTQQPWEMYKAQCVVRGPDNSVKIGELILPKSLAETTPGDYLAEFELDVSFERVVVPRITALHPHGKSAAPAPKATA
ncbi:hypothetical protein [uncultured Oxalicibacterium sp.]|uniref:hypothetical protein n=1 Tax=uncultured Oxalicibacterium sp. TaxID=1168540 RepID=UPI0025CE13BB|nr:hypothetical protein [uncultured Oxalicibacterium sp.]